MRVLDLLRRNPNYRYAWLGQVVSEIGDHFNNIAVFGLVMETTGSGLVVSGVMLARAIPALLAGPIAGVALDRFDRRKIMIASDLVRAVLAILFLLTIHNPRLWLLYLLSALLMFASPFFSSGRSAILPDIAAPDELHAANSLTQTTQWATLTAGTMLAGWSAARFGYEAAFFINSFSFIFSAAAIYRIKSASGDFRGRRAPGTEGSAIRPWHDYREGLDYIRSVPLILGIGLLTVGWAAGGGAAQILFALFGEQVFHRGAAGIGTIWGFAGIGLMLGGAIGHLVGSRVGFRGYKETIAISYFLHGATYVAFSVSVSYPLALMWVCFSRVGMAVSSVLNQFQLLRYTPHGLRGRVFSTMESLRWAAMILSMAAAGACSEYFTARQIGVVAGALGSATAVAWAIGNWSGRLPKPDSPP